MSCLDVTEYWLYKSFVLEYISCLTGICFLNENDSLKKKKSVMGRRLHDSLSRPEL